MTTTRLKQVLVLRKDLNMRKGKMAAQASHASWHALFDPTAATAVPTDDGRVAVTFVLTADEWAWCRDMSTKIVLGVDSEAQLVDVHQRARAAGLPCALIRDAGLTEFAGRPTLTAVGIGPAEADRIDPITGGLTLL